MNEMRVGGVIISTSIEFSKEEANSLVDLLHHAVRAEGLKNNVARSAIYFQDKIAGAFVVKPGKEIRLDDEVKKEGKTDDKAKKSTNGTTKPIAAAGTGTKKESSATN